MSQKKKKKEDSGTWHTYVTPFFTLKFKLQKNAEEDRPMDETHIVQAAMGYNK